MAYVNRLDAMKNSIPIEAFAILPFELKASATQHGGDVAAVRRKHQHLRISEPPHFFVPTSSRSVTVVNTTRVARLRFCNRATMVKMDGGHTFLRISVIKPRLIDLRFLHSEVFVNGRAQARAPAIILSSFSRTDFKLIIASCPGNPRRKYLSSTHILAPRTILPNLEHLRRIFLLSHSLLLSLSFLQDNLKPSVQHLPAPERATELVFAAVPSGAETNVA